MVVELLTQGQCAQTGQFTICTAMFNNTQASRLNLVKCMPQLLLLFCFRFHFVCAFVTCMIADQSIQ